MINIKPKTYNEAVLLARCLQVRQYAPGLMDEVVENMYNFLSENPGNRVGIADGIIYFETPTDKIGEVIKRDVYSVVTTEKFKQLILGAQVFWLSTVSDTSDSSGCGCGGNNNNNNNNNNNA